MIGTTRSVVVLAGILLVTAAVIAPPVVSFALAVVTAIMWCFWLDARPAVQTDDPQGESASREVARAPWIVHVLATSDEGTRCALQTAKRLIRGLDGQVVLFVPRVTRFASAFNPASAERTVLVDRAHLLASDVGVPVRVLFCVCQRLDDVAHQLLGRSQLLIVGGHGRLWWPGRERRLVERLAGQGYPVVFADVNASCSDGLRSPALVGGPEC